MPGGHFNHPAGNSFLKPASAFRDIAKVGALCRQLRTRLREGRVWKALAERFTLRCCLKICDFITFDQLFFFSSYHWTFQAEIACLYSSSAICQKTQPWEETLQNYHWYCCWASKKCVRIEGGQPEIRWCTKGWRDEVSYPQVAWGKPNWTGFQPVAEEHYESVNAGGTPFQVCQRGILKLI